MYWICSCFSFPCRMVPVCKDYSWSEFNLFDLLTELFSLIYFRKIISFIIFFIALNTVHNVDYCFLSLRPCRPRRASFFFFIFLYLYYRFSVLLNLLPDTFVTLDHATQHLISDDNNTHHIHFPQTQTASRTNAIQWLLLALFPGDKDARTWNSLCISI